MTPGTIMLFQMAQARRFNSWVAETIASEVSGEVLEIGAGIGNLTEFLVPYADRYTALDSDEEHLRAIEQRLGKRPNLQTVFLDAADASGFSALSHCFDTVVALNVLEHIANDEAALRNIHRALRLGGKAIVLVPQCKAAFGSLDRVLEHRRRYSRHELIEKMTGAGFDIERLLHFNRATLPGWILNSRILRRRTLSNTQLRVFDSLVPLWRRIDRFLPWPATSLIAVGVKS